MSANERPDIICGVSMLPCHRCGRYFDIKEGFHITKDEIIVCKTCVDDILNEENNESN